MRFDIFKGEDHSVAFDDVTGRYSLFVKGDLAVSSVNSDDVLQRASDKKVALTPVAFNAGTSYDGKPIQVTPKKGKWEVEAGSASTEFEMVSACVQAALAKRQPPPKKTIMSK